MKNLTFSYRFLRAVFTVSVLTLGTLHADWYAEQKTAVSSEINTNEEYGANNSQAEFDTQEITKNYPPESNFPRETITVGAEGRYSHICDYRDANGDPMICQLSMSLSPDISNLQMNAETHQLDFNHELLPGQSGEILVNIVDVDSNNEPKSAPLPIVITVVRP